MAPLTAYATSSHITWSGSGGKLISLFSDGWCTRWGGGASSGWTQSMSSCSHLESNTARHYDVKTLTYCRSVVVGILWLMDVKTEIVHVVSAKLHPLVRLSELSPNLLYSHDTADSTSSLLNLILLGRYILKSSNLNCFRPVRAWPEAEPQPRFNWDRNRKLQTETKRLRDISHKPSIVATAKLSTP